MWINFLLPRVRRSTNVVKLQPSSFDMNLDSPFPAIVQESIYPKSFGRVHFMGTYWPARCDRPIALVVGQSVRVIRRDGIVLIVEPFFGDH
jgi:membrane-bound ClpP family serine protease